MSCESVLRVTRDRPEVVKNGNEPDREIGNGIDFINCSICHAICPALIRQCQIFDQTMLYSDWSLPNRINFEKKFPKLLSAKTSDYVIFLTFNITFRHGIFRLLTMKV